MPDYSTRPLESETWADFAQLVEAGELEEIARLGGGMVESYPDAMDGRPVSSSFIHNGTIEMFERLGFDRVRPIGKNRWVARKLVA